MGRESETWAPRPQRVPPDKCRAEKGSSGVAWGLLGDGKRATARPIKSQALPDASGLRSVAPMGGSADGEGDLPGTSADGTDEDRTQVPLAVDRMAYYKTGELNVVEGPLGELPQVLGEPPVGPEPGVREDNFVCLGAPGRPPCRHLAQVLLPAPGVAKGFAAMKQIRAFCLRMATASELYEVDGEIFACTLRDPPDEASAAKIDEFRARQQHIEKEMNETSGELDF